MTKAFLHVNGTTYELASALDDAQVTQLVDQISGGDKPQRVDVVFDRARTALKIDCSKVWAVAGWVKERGHGSTGSVL